jgi:purine-nucleoside phosphorylase
MDCAEAWGRRLGMSRCSLEVGTANEAAIGLYRALGYEISGSIADYYEPGRDAFRMERGLGSPTGLEELQSRLSSVLNGLFPALPELGVILGSGLGWIADLTNAHTIASYDDLPGLEQGDIPGHRGLLRVSEDGAIIFLEGRRHHYQGLDCDQIALLPGCLSDVGVMSWLLTCSAGGLSTDLRPGDLMVFTDHLNLSCQVPSDANCRPAGAFYDAEAIGSLSLEPLPKGVFACVSGPSYETVEEVRFLAKAGASAVSMSTVPEALTLAGRGCRVSAIATITNDCTGDVDPTHEEVLASQQRIREKHSDDIQSILKGLSGSEIL